MGNPPIAKEETAHARMAHWLGSSFQDLQHGVTLLRRDAGASALIVAVQSRFPRPASLSASGAAGDDHGKHRLGPERLRISGDSLAQPRAWGDGVCRAPRYAAFRNRRASACLCRSSHRFLFSATWSECVTRPDVSRGRESAGPNSVGDRHRRLLALENGGGLWRGWANAPARWPPCRSCRGAAAAFHFDYRTLRIPERVDIYVSYPLKRSALVRPSAKR